MSFQYTCYQQVKGNNRARQTRDSTTKTWIAYGNSTWHASKCKVHELHLRYILDKGCPQWHIYPPFQAHSATQVCTGIWQNQFLLEIGHKPLILKLAQHKNTHIYTHLHVSLRVNCCNCWSYIACIYSHTRWTYRRRLRSLLCTLSVDRYYFPLFVGSSCV